MKQIVDGKWIPVGHHKRVEYQKNLITKNYGKIEGPQISLSMW